MRFRNLLTLLLVASFAPTLAAAQDSLVNWRGARQVLDREWGDDLQELAGWCRGNGLPRQVEATFALYQPRDLGRLYIFPPTEKTTPAKQPGKLGEWLDRLIELKRQHGAKIFDLARRAAEAGDGSASFQLLNEVLYYDRDHADVRRMLGHRKTDEGWRVAPEKIRVRLGSRTHPTLRWPAKSYLIVQTPFFVISSKATEAQTVALAEKLERWHAIWRQVFFDYWSSSKTITRWFEGKSHLKYPRKRFEVAFFKDQTQYVEELSKSIPNVAGSTGYYSSAERISYFPHGEKRFEDTWRHELTHQLFRESVNTKGEPFEQQFIWLDEGIAAWFESLTDMGDYVTLGGFDSRRIQYSRIRAFHEKFYIPLEELAKLGRQGLQTSPDMVRIYSQSAGVADMLMNGEAGSMSRGLTEFLRLIYAGKLRPGSFEKLIGKSWQELDQSYPKFLLTDSDTVTKHLSAPETRTELSLRGANLDDAAFEAIGQCVNLTWLDVSRNTVVGKHIEQLSDCTQLNQLFMVGCSLDTTTFRAMSVLPKLQELELSVASLENEHMAAIAALSTVTSLRIAGTRVTDQGILKLVEMKNLKTLDVSKTGISESAISTLRNAIPGIVITQ